MSGIMAAGEASTTAFLNVDLELRAKSGLTDLPRYLEPAMFMLYQTDDFVAAELNEQYRSAEETLAAITSLIETLPADAKQLLKRCESRKLDIGIQAGTAPHQTAFSVSSNTLSLVAKLDFEIVITVYAPSADVVATEA